MQDNHHPLHYKLASLNGRCSCRLIVTRSKRAGCMMPHMTAQPPSPRGRRKWPYIIGGIIVVIIVVSIVSNSGGGSTNTAASTSTISAPTTTTTTTAAPATTTQQAAAPAPTTTGCALPTNKPDLIEREITPNLPPHAILIGAVNFASCTLTVDSFAAASPTGTGYCTQIAAAADNPGYNVDAPATPPLRNLIDQVGGAC